MDRDSKPKSTAKCHVCGATGHYVQECNDRKSETGKVVLHETIGFATTEDRVLSKARSRGWYFITRCTVHVCNSRDMFVEYRPLSNHEVIMKDILLPDGNCRMDVLGIGTVMLRLTTGKILTLSNVFHMPGIRKCCLSLPKLGEIGLGVALGKGGGLIKGENLVGKGYLDGGLFRLSIVEECAGGIEMHKETMGLVTDHLDEDNNPWARGWYLNSKTNLHMCNSRGMFVDYRTLHRDEQVNMSENDSVKVDGIGTVMVRFTTGKVLTLSNVCYAPTVDKCLVSISELDDNGFSMVFGGGEVVIKKSHEIFGKGYKQGGLYRLSVIEGRRDAPEASKRAKTLN